MPACLQTHALWDTSGVLGDFQVVLPWKLSDMLLPTIAWVGVLFRSRLRVIYLVQVLFSFLRFWLRVVH
jgi:hypothetical protein